MDRKSKSPLTGLQYDKLREYIDFFIEENDVEWPIKSILMLSGYKPGTLISPHPWKHDHLSGSCTEFLEVFDLSYTKIGGSPQWYVASNSDRIDALPSDFDDQETRHRILGNFFGYPNNVVDFFIDADISVQEQPQEFISENIFEPEEMAWSEFVFYMPINTVLGYEQAIDHGKQNRDHLLNLASNWEIPKIETLVERRHHNSIEFMKK